MNYSDPLRPHLGNGLACWLGTQIAIPLLCIQITETGFSCMMMFEGQWIYASPAHGPWVQALAEDYRADPEACLKNWFGRELSQTKQISLDSILGEL